MQVLEMLEPLRLELQLEGLMEQTVATSWYSRILAAVR